MTLQWDDPVKAPLHRLKTLLITEACRQTCVFPTPPHGAELAAASVATRAEPKQICGAERDLRLCRNLLCHRFLLG